MAVRGRVFYDGMVTDPRLDHPEGVAVHPDGSVWCGGENGQIFRLEPDGSRLELIASTGGFILGIAFGGDGELYACDLAHRAVFRVDTDRRTVEMFTDGGSDRPFVTPNYPVVAADGTVFVSDSGTAEQAAPGIYRFDPGGDGGLWCDHRFAFANGMAWSPDGSALLVVESFGPCVTRVPILADGSPGPVARVLSLPGTVPDGIAVGPDGLVYIACYEPSRILRADLRSADVTTLLADPTAELLCHPTNLAFRGSELFAANLGRWHLTVIDGLSAKEQVR